jgi:hypothetical protein
MSYKLSNRHFKGCAFLRINDKLSILVETLAQIAVESFCSGKPIFCCCKKATKGSSFCNVQKRFETKNLQRIAGTKLQKKASKSIDFDAQI